MTDTARPRPGPVVRWKTTSHQWVRDWLEWPGISRFVPLAEAGMLAAWKRFAKSLTQVLRVLEEGQILVLQAKNGPAEIRLGALACMGLRAEMRWKSPEASPSATLPAPHDVLRRLRWRHVPDGRNAPPRQVQSGTRREPYFRQWSVCPPPIDVAAFVVQTFVKLFRVTRPDHLAYSAFSRTGSEILLPTLGLDRAWLETPPEITRCRMIWPADGDDLMGILLHLLRRQTGMPKLKAYGGNQIIWRKASVAFTACVDEYSGDVSLSSPLLRSCDRSPALLAVLNKFNVICDNVKFIHAGERVWATATISTDPLVSRHFETTLAHFEVTCIEKARDLRRRFGLPGEPDRRHICPDAKPIGPIN